MKVNSQAMRDKIIALVEKNPDLANDDKRLIATVWWTEGWHDPELYEHLKSVSSPETIRRTRQKLIEEGVITPSEETTAARAQEEQEVRRML